MGYSCLSCTTCITLTAFIFLFPSFSNCAYKEVYGGFFNGKSICTVSGTNIQPFRYATRRHYSDGEAIDRRSGNEQPVFLVIMTGTQSLHLLVRSGYAWSTNCNGYSRYPIASFACTILKNRSCLSTSIHSVRDWL